MRVGRVIFVGVWLQFLGGAAMPASAQPTTPPASDAAPDPDANARRLYGAGSTAYEEHRYEDALGYFEQAYELTPRPTLLYNIGLAAEHAGRRARAIEAFEAYVAAAPDAENRIEVDRRLEVLHRVDSSAAQPTLDTVPPPVEPIPSAQPGEDPTQWILLGGGLALLAGGGITLGLGAADYASVSGLPDGGTWASVHGAADRAPILVGVGAACAGVGLVAALVGIVMASSGGSHGSGQTALRLGPGTLIVEGIF